MIRYKVSKYRIDIEPLEVVRETEKSVYIQQGRGLSRQAKETAYDQWFTTWQDAYNFLVKRTESKIEYLKGRLEDTEDNLTEILNMEKPAEA